MVTTLKICEAIRALIMESIPEIRKVYLDLLPEGNERPGILLRPISRTVEDAAAALVKVTEKLHIGITDVANAAGAADTEQAMGLQAKVCSLFAPGYLWVEGRALHAVAGGGKREQDMVFVELTLDFFEDRPSTAAALEIMETVGTNMHVKE